MGHGHEARRQRSQAVAGRGASAGSGSGASAVSTGARAPRYRKEARAEDAKGRKKFGHASSRRDAENDARRLCLRPRRPSLPVAKWARRALAIARDLAHFVADAAREPPLHARNRRNHERRAAAAPARLAAGRGGLGAQGRRVVAHGDAAGRLALPGRHRSAGTLVSVSRAACFLPDAPGIGCADPRGRECANVRSAKTDNSDSYY
mmetsp:Transcript_37994/g.121906  ORF Transcript_37994/g.121906 Transcript_37994/m.121906 type:complete len:206 (-) Transcript_37994:2379-2996(-)